MILSFPFLFFFFHDLEVVSSSHIPSFEAWSCEQQYSLTSDLIYIKQVCHVINVHNKINNHRMQANFSVELAFYFLQFADKLILKVTEFNQTIWISTKAENTKSVKMKRTHCPAHESPQHGIRPRVYCNFISVNNLLLRQLKVCALC